MFLDYLNKILMRGKCVYGSDVNVSRFEAPEKKEEEAECHAGNTIPAFKNDIVILLDNGHAECTCGKRSPDGKFREYEFSRDIVRRIADKLDKLGIKYHIITPEIQEDVALSKRAARANEYCCKYGTANCLFISIHSNASGNGCTWMPANGWSVWTTKGKTKSDVYADVFWDEANKLLSCNGMSMRKDLSDGDKDYEENFTVIYKTKCPAILTENLFMDNKKDCDFLKSEYGREIIADIHVNAIKRIENGNY